MADVDVAYNEDLAPPELRALETPAEVEIVRRNAARAVLRSLAVR